MYHQLFKIDTLPPQVIASSAAGITPVQLVSVEANDDYAGVSWVHISNDPQMLDGVMTLPYSSDSLTWAVDDRRIAWIKVEDSVGNVSTAYPVYAGRASSGSQMIYLPIIRR